MSQLKIFVSYAHADFEPRPGYKESRVGQILSDVKHELNCHASRSRFKILRDAEELLEPSDAIHAKLDEAMRDCAMALILLSENYCASEECAWEFSRLLELRRPLFLVETEDVWSQFAHHLEPHRAQSREILAVAFWGTVEKGTANERKAVFGYPLPHSEESQHKKPYFENMETLTTSIKKKANELLGRDIRPPAPAKPASGKCTVFLACPTADVKPEAHRLQKALEAEGHSVHQFDPKVDVRDGDDPEQVIAGLIAGSDMYVQLLGGVPGRKLSAQSDLPLVPAQYRIASGTEVQTQTWRQPDFDVGECDPAYAEFLNGLGSHVTPYEEFERYLKKRVNDITEARSLTEQRMQKIEDQGGGEARPLMAIDVAKSDAELAKKIASAFGKHVDVSTLPFELTRSDLDEAVGVHDAVILGYGASEDGQNRAQSHFSIIRRKMADSRAKQLKLAVGDGAPPTAPPCPRGPDVPIIAVREEVDETAMMDFLRRLRPKGEPAGPR
jgi:hypothetical protein